MTWSEVFSRKDCTQHWVMIQKENIIIFITSEWLLTSKSMKWSFRPITLNPLGDNFPGIKLKTTSWNSILNGLKHVRASIHGIIEFRRNVFIA